MAHGQAEALLPMVDCTMREAGLPASALDFVAVTTGPGSFTGIRVGLAAARGVALALEVPLLGVTGFEAAAAAYIDPDISKRFLLVALESRRVDLYIELFDPARRALGMPAAVMPEALAAIVSAADARPLAVTGDAAARATAALAARGCPSVVDDGALAVVGAVRAALARWRWGERAGSARPFYLRPPDVTPAAGARAPGRP
jgi:tRNA threonylcarbamoyladenosine biosynthesis protein TsaB